jgi:hypothetical protein
MGVRAAIVATSLVAIVAATSVTSAGAAHHSKPKGHKSLTVDVPLPTAGEASVTQLTVAVAGPPAAAQSLTPHTLDEGSLPSGIRAMTAIEATAHSRGTTTLTLDIGVNDLTGSATTATTGPGPPHQEDLVIKFEGHSRNVITRTVSWRIPADCKAIVERGEQVDRIRKREAEYDEGKTTRRVSTPIYLTPLRRPPIQTSSPEEILDHIGEHCPGGEPVDAGES